MKYEYYTQVSKRKPIYKKWSKRLCIFFIAWFGFVYMTTDFAGQEAEAKNNARNILISGVVRNAPADASVVPILMERKIEADRDAKAVKEREAQRAQAEENEREIAKRNEQLIIPASERLIRQILKDPDSAQFKEIFASRKGGVLVACGQVNARNSFGGYTGWKHFVTGYSEGTGMIEDGSPRFASLYNTLCLGVTEQPPKKSKK